jgi:hypothetical protein
MGSQNGREKPIWNWIDKEHPDAIKDRIREHLYVGNLSRRDLLRSLNYRRFPVAILSTVLEEMIRDGEIAAAPQVKVKGRPRSDILSLTRLGHEKHESFLENSDNTRLKWNCGRKMKPSYWLNR